MAASELKPIKVQVSSRCSDWMGRKEEEAIKDLKSVRAQQLCLPARLPVAYFIRVCNKTHIRSDIYESGVIQPITGPHYS